MAKYTMEIRELISTFGEDEVKSWFSQYELSDYLTQEQIDVINEKGVWSKEQLETRIINHFYTREIGTDAIGQFIMFAKDKMAEIMETYVPLIYTASIKFDPLVNVDFTETYSGATSNSENGTTSGNSTSSSTTNNSGLTVNSDTPQGQISKSAILGGSYASSTGANESTGSVNDTSSNSGTSSSNGSGTQNYTKRTKGNSGVSATAQKMIEQTRDIIRAINTEIVYELEPLFMGLY